MKRIFKTVPVVLCVVFLLGTLGQAFADVLSDIKEKGVITVGTSADYPPYEFKDESDNFVGFDMELMGEIAKRMGVKLEVVDMGFDTLIAALQNNKVGRRDRGHAGHPGARRESRFHRRLPQHFRRLSGEGRVRDQDELSL